MSPVSRIVAAADAALTRADAVAAIAGPLQELRAELERPLVGAGPPRIFGDTLPPIAGTASAAELAARIHRHRLDIQCARAFGSADDVERVIVVAVNEVRAAVLWRFTR